MKKIAFFSTAALLLTIISSQAQDTTHKDIIGKYKFPAGSVVEDVTVAQENGALSMTSSAGVSALETIKGDSFNIVSFNGIAVFQRSAVKKVIGVHIDASGYVLDGVKDSTSGHMVFTAHCKTPVIATSTLDDVSMLIINDEIAQRRNTSHLRIEATKSKE